jgi:MFS superfamily sulfate permease-like transporter
MSTITQRYGYGFASLRSDLQAALTVAAISLPQSIAYALIAGVDPRFGLYTAIVFTAIAAILGSSSHLVNGPTGAVSLVVFSALAFIDPDARLDAYEAMFLLTAMVGIVQIAIAVLKLGDLMRYISESVVTGFMVGAATLTIVGQVGNAARAVPPVDDLGSAGPREPKGLRHQRRRHPPRDRRAQVGSSLQTASARYARRTAARVDPGVLCRLVSRRWQ